MQTQRQDKSSLNVLDKEVYMVDWESKKMTNLPFKKTTEAPSFAYCGIDMFGPFYIKEKRSEFKRCGVVFVCLAIRVVHIEMTHQTDTDSLIQALWRTIARRKCKAHTII